MYRRPVLSSLGRSLSQDSPPSPSSASARAGADSVEFVARLSFGGLRAGDHFQGSPHRRASDSLLAANDNRKRRFLLGSSHDERAAQDAGLWKAAALYQWAAPTVGRGELSAGAAVDDVEGLEGLEGLEGGPGADGLFDAEATLFYSTCGSVPPMPELEKEHARLLELLKVGGGGEVCGRVSVLPSLLPVSHVRLPPPFSAPPHFPASTRALSPLSSRPPLTPHAPTQALWQHNELVVSTATELAWLRAGAGQRESEDGLGDEAAAQTAAHVDELPRASVCVPVPATGTALGSVGAAGAAGSLIASSTR